MRSWVVAGSFAAAAAARSFHFLQGTDQFWFALAFFESCFGLMPSSSRPVDFPRTSIGREFFRRLWLISDEPLCFEDQVSAIEVLGILKCPEFRAYVVDLLSDGGCSLHARRMSSVSRYVESSAFLSNTHLDVSRPLRVVCCTLGGLRLLVHFIDFHFFYVRSCGSGSYRCRRNGWEVDWKAVRLQLFSFPRSIVRLAYRDLRFQSLVGTLSSHAAGSDDTCSSVVQCSFLHFLSSFYCLGDGAFLSVLMLFDSLDVEIVFPCEIPFIQVRDVRFGSPANVFRLNFDASPSSSSDEFASRSPIFAFLRRRFREGPHFRPDLPDDYGQLI